MTDSKMKNKVSEGNTLMRHTLATAGPLSCKAGKRLQE